MTGWPSPSSTWRVAMAVVGAAPEYWAWDWYRLDVLWKLGAGILAGRVIGRLLGWLAFRMPNRARLSRTGDGFVAPGGHLPRLWADRAGAWLRLPRRLSSRRWRCATPNASTTTIDRRHDRRADRAAADDGAAGAIRRRAGRPAAGAPGGPGRAAALVFVFLVRPAAGLLSLIGTTRPLAERAAIAFFGIRGLGSFYYLAFAANAAAFPEMPGALGSGRADRADLGRTAWGDGDAGDAPAGWMPGAGARGRPRWKPERRSGRASGQVAQQAEWISFRPGIADLHPADTGLAMDPERLPARRGAQDGGMVVRAGAEIGGGADQDPRQCRRRLRGCRRGGRCRGGCCRGGRRLGCTPWCSARSVRAAAVAGGGAGAGRPAAARPPAASWGTIAAWPQRDAAGPAGAAGAAAGRAAPASAAAPPRRRCRDPAACRAAPASGRPAPPRSARPAAGSSSAAGRGGATAAWTSRAPRPPLLRRQHHRAHQRIGGRTSSARRTTLTQPSPPAGAAAAGWRRPAAAGAEADPAPPGSMAGAPRAAGPGRSR